MVDKINAKTRVPSIGRLEQFEISETIKARDLNRRNNSISVSKTPGGSNLKLPLIGAKNEQKN